jgi:aminoglycoside phosphotransferase (APT) family kinase protein
MTPRKMHADELEIDAALVHRLLAAQFPQWSELPIVRVPSAGTDNAIYRLGDELAVRLPRRPNAAASLSKEQQWLPHLAPHLPLAVPVPLGSGKPAAGYPWRWSVCRWLLGVDFSREPIPDLHRAATDLARFVTALQRVEATNGPAPGAHNFGRGVPLALRDDATRTAIARLGDRIDTPSVTAAWEAALWAPAWTGPPVWIHGDLEPGNLLVEDGRLSAVIDFGGLGVGDPTCDLLPAWSLFAGESRDVFRAALGADAATWERGRGWALSTALIALPYYWDTNPVIVAMARHKIAEVLAEHASRGG